MSRISLFGLLVWVVACGGAATPTVDADASHDGDSPGAMAWLGGAVDLQNTATLTFVDWPSDAATETNAKIITGPQGGQHIWTSIRMKGLSPKKLRMAVTMHDVETGELIKPGRVEITHSVEPGPNGWFEYVGLPAFIKEPCKVQLRKLKADLELNDLYGLHATDSAVIVAGSYDGYCPPGAGTGNGTSPSVDATSTVEQ